tara:strand:- start:491 stop:2287 length:1797 start_codon:yes stop_codon:yes gene_type:complete
MVNYQPLYVATDKTITSVENSTSNIQFCESNNKINTISVNSLVNKNINEDLNLSAFNGNVINPIIKINNTNNDCNITSNLNVSGNLNVIEKSRFNKLINCAGGINYYNNTLDTLNKYNNPHTGAFNSGHGGGDYIFFNPLATGDAKDDVLSIDINNVYIMKNINVNGNSTFKSDIRMINTNIDFYYTNADTNTIGYIGCHKTVPLSSINPLDYMYLAQGTAGDNLRLYGSYTASCEDFRCLKTLNVTGISSFNNKITINKVINSIGVNSFHNQKSEQQLLIGNTNQACNSILTLEGAGGQLNACGIKLVHHTSRHGGYIVATDETESTTDTSPIDRSKTVTHDAMSIGVYNVNNPKDKILMSYAKLNSIFINTDTDYNYIKFTKNYVENGWIGIKSTTNEHFMFLNVGGVDVMKATKTQFKIHVLAKLSNDAIITSDDRLKMNEALITGVDAKNIIMKLRPQTYDKYSKMNSDNKTTDLTSTKIFEAGLIAQEIYYEVPELRFIVHGAPTNETNTDNINISDSNIQTDPDYSNWGSETAGVSYTQLIPYLIAHNKIQQDEINNLQTKVSTLETQLNTYKNIIDKLITSNSFEEFKNSL